MHQILPVGITQSSMFTYPSDYIAELACQAKHPPGGDPCIGAFNQSVVDLFYEGSQIASLLNEVVRNRSITPPHLVNLLFRAVQYMELHVLGNTAYPEDFTEPSVWKRELARLLDSHSALLKEILLIRNTQTTKYQRYAGLKFVLSFLLPMRSLRVADFGCGGNYGLPGLTVGEPFAPIVDHTADSLFTEYLSRPSELIEGLALDQFDPYTQEATTWRLACSLYPSELHTLEQVRAFEARLKHNATTVRFLETNLLNLDLDGEEGIPSHHFDAVAMSTVLYQMGPVDQQQVISSALRLLKPDGLIFIQDFATKHYNNLTLDCNHGNQGNWFAQPWAYCSFVAAATTDWEVKEVLRWYNGRCQEVMEGEDFTALFGTTYGLHQHQRSGAALRAVAIKDI